MTKEPLATAKYLHPLENGGCHRWNWADGSDGVRHRHRRRKAPSFPGSGFLISEKPAENLQVVFISIFRLRRKLPALHDSTVTLLLTLSSTCFVPVLLTRYIGDDEAIYHLKRGNNTSRQWLAVTRTPKRVGNGAITSESGEGDNLFPKGSIIHGNVAQCLYYFIVFSFRPPPFRWQGDRGNDFCGEWLSDNWLIIDSNCLNNCTN